MQHKLLRHIAEVYIAQLYITPQGRIGDASVRLMGMSPCPQTGLVIRFTDLSIFILFGVDKLDISSILFRKLIHQKEDTSRACKTHSDQ